MAWSGSVVVAARSEAVLHFSVSAAQRLCGFFLSFRGGFADAEARQRAFLLLYFFTSEQ